MALQDIFQYPYSPNTNRRKDHTNLFPRHIQGYSAEDKINLISEIADALTAQQLRVVREMVDQKRLGKLDEAKAQMIEEMRDKFLQLDLDFDEVMGFHRQRRTNRHCRPNTDHQTEKLGAGGDTLPCGFESMKRPEEIGKITL